MECGSNDLFRICVHGSMRNKSAGINRVCESICGKGKKLTTRSVWAVWVNEIFHGYIRKMIVNSLSNKNVSGSQIEAEDFFLMSWKGGIKIVWRTYWS